MPDPQPTSRPLRVFLCHAREDKPAVRALYQRLKVAGYAPWLDEEDLLPGRKWEPEIQKAIRTSDAVIVCLSPQSVTKAGFVNKEIKEILDIADQQPEGAIFLIPLRLEDCQVPDRLKDWHWVDYFDARGFDRLLRALQERAANLRLDPSEPPPAPPAAAPGLAPKTATVPPHPPADPQVIAPSKEINRLLETMRRPDLPPKERAAAGRTLADLGDPRPEVTTLDGMEFCYVPPGPFRMGSSDQDEIAFYTEKPQHEVKIPYSYWIARYPVTVAQFRAYAERSGTKPADPQSLTGPENTPVVYVSWKECQAFCAWLSDQWRAAGRLPSGWSVQLHSEAEWEKAARGGPTVPITPLIIPAGQGFPAQGHPNLPAQPNPLPARRFPWGDAPDTYRANYENTGINATSAVGCFPGGASPYGVEELSGNVWEWTRSLWGKNAEKPDFKYPYDPRDGRENLQAPDDMRRVLRGGAFVVNVTNVRCASRNRGRPDSRRDLAGFRVVVSPSL